MPRFFTVNTVINRVAAEVGLTPVADPYSDPNDAFQQLRHLLDSAGQELIELHDWEMFKFRHTITTKSTDSGTYLLPTNFSRMINQTGWDRTNNKHLAGPLSSQDWEYLEGRDLVSHTLYATFQIQQGQFQLFPRPPPNGLKLTFLYIARDWLQNATDNVRKDVVESGSDIVLFEPILVIKFLKALFLEAKGFDSKAARDEFGYMFAGRTGKDEGAQVLNAGRGSRGYPYVNPWSSLPDTNYGS